MLRTIETLPNGCTSERVEEFGHTDLDTFLIALSLRDPFCAADDAIISRAEGFTADYNYAHGRLAAMIGLPRHSTFHVHPVRLHKAAYAF